MLPGVVFNCSVILEVLGIFCSDGGDLEARKIKKKSNTEWKKTSDTALPF